MPSVMVLGPSRWLDGERRGSPLTLRRWAAATLRDHGLPAIVMEDEAQERGEAHTAFFTRLLREHDVRWFVVLWPLSARLHGFEKEAGDLLRWLHDHVLDPTQVYLFVQRGLLGASREVWALSEPGNRTRYHEDFLGYGVAVRTWDDAASLEAHVRSLLYEVKEAPRWHERLPASPPA